MSLLETVLVKLYLEGPGEGPHLHSPTPAVDSDAGEAGIIRAAVSFRRADVEGGAAKAALEIRTRAKLSVNLNVQLVFSLRSLLIVKVWHLSLI